MILKNLIGITTQGIESTFEKMRTMSSNKIPYELEGIYYLDGSKTNDYFATMNGSKYDIKKNKIELKVSSPNSFIFDGTKGGCILFFAKLLDLRYDITFDQNFNNGILRPKLFKYLKIPKCIFYGTFQKTEENVWQRDNYLFKKCKIGNYLLKKIINNDNTRIDKNYPSALSKINKYSCESECCCDSGCNGKCSNGKCSNGCKRCRSCCSKCGYRFVSNNRFSIIDLPGALLYRDIYIYYFKKLQLFVTISSEKSCILKKILKPLSYVVSLCDMVLLMLYKERQPYFEDMHRICGNPFPYGYGIMYCDNKQVSENINGNSTKGKVIGTLPVVIPDTFGPKTLIFLNNKEHTLYRKIYENLLSNHLVLEYPQIWFENLYNSAGQNEDVTELVIRMIFYRCMNIKNLSSDDIESIFNYEKNRIGIILPKWIHTLTCNKLLKKVRLTRESIINIVKKSEFVEEIREEIKDTYISEDDLIIGFVDILLFAGVIGTKHLVYDCILKLRNKSLTQINHNLRDYIHECARLNPPVTSVNTINQEEYNEQIMNSTYKVPNNLALGWCISEAETDSDKYKTPLEFDMTRDYENTLVWNGSGVRKCIGRGISIQLTRIILKETIARTLHNDTFIYRLGENKRQLKCYEKVLYKLYLKSLKKMIKSGITPFNSYKYKPRKLTILEKNQTTSNKLYTNVQKGDSFNFVYLDHSTDISLLSTPPVEMMDSKCESLSHFFEYKLRNLIVSIGKHTGSRFSSYKQASEILSDNYQKDQHICKKVDIMSPSGLFNFFTEDIGILLLTKTADTHILYASTYDTFDNCCIKQNRVNIDFELYLNTTTKEITKLRIHDKNDLNNSMDYVIVDNYLFRKASRLVLTMSIARIVLVNHFFNLHKLTAESISATIHKELDEHHPIFRIICPHSINIFKQNDNASKFLFDDKIKGTLHHFLPIDSVSHPQIATYAINNYNIFNLVSFIELDTNLASDAKLFYDAMKTYVTNYINYYYEDEYSLYIDPQLVIWFQSVQNFVPNTDNLTFTKKNIISIITIFMFGSSVIHEIAGAALSDLYHNPFIISPSLINNGLSHYDMQPYIYEVLLANVALYGTSLHAVSLKTDYSDKIGDDEESIQIVKNAWKSFNQVHEIIKNRNKDREYKQDIINMDTLEYSIAT